MKKDEIFIVSDATGETAEKLVLSVIAQFDKSHFEIKKFSKVSQPEEIKDIVKKALHKEAVIVYTLAQKWMRELIVRECEHSKINYIDLLGPVMSKFAQYFSIKPVELPGAQHKIDEYYFKKIDAIEFTVKHDDGNNIDTVYEADIVIIGVSRTSKTPLSIYLSHENWKVANIPFIQDLAIDIDLSKLQNKVVGLTIDPVYLTDIRKVRLKHMGKDLNNRYADLKYVYEEINASIDFFRKKKIPTVDVTKKSIEETAGEILKILNKTKVRY
ncbi:MAG: kinase/pyrophosphorylase [Proteobacteria bacterium]|nr:kinase/pyrophosphorylase [Pseudomonadota bacterium]